MRAEALSPTDRADLDSVLAELVARVRAVLRHNFLGAYLQGSFALGAGDVHSDLDFLIVTRREIDHRQESGLGDVHAALPDLPSHWAQHLEGSYVAVTALQIGAHHGATTDEWLYVDNGSRTIGPSSHDNTAAVRWILRERGIVLAGPPPITLTVPVSAGQLRREARNTALVWSRAVAANPDRLDNALAQQQHVLALCRVMFTAAVGEIASKAGAGRWVLDSARADLPQGFRRLIQRAIDQRPDPWVRVHQSAEPSAVAQTLAFSDYVTRVVAG